jgi:hypothetical protein
LGGRALSYLEARLGRPTSVYESGHSKTKRQPDEERPVARILAAVSLIFAIAGGLGAQEAGMPPVARRGLDLLVSDSTDAAVAFWTIGWDGPADEGKAEQLIAGFRQIRDLGGRVRGYDVLKLEAVSPHLIRVFALVRYERLPVFFELLAYDPGSASPAWRMATVRFNTEPTKVLPPALWPRP